MAYRRPLRLLIGVLALACGACGTNTSVTPAATTDAAPLPAQAQAPEMVRRVRVFYNPYRDVDWSNDRRLKAQHHDHVSVRPDWLLAYDRAGYQVMSLMDYSGNPLLPYTLRQRIWPAEAFVVPWMFSELRNIKVMMPNGEEVGTFAHLTSPFLTRYIESVPTSQIEVADHQYRTIEEAFTLMRRGNGFPCLAHPWTVSYTQISGAFCVEIYTAAESASRHLRVPFFSTIPPEHLVQIWDYALQYNQRIWGIAVNDHFGPYQAGFFPADIVDSGKIIVLAKAASLAEYQDAFVRGAFFAIQDRGDLKDRYPDVRSITVTRDEIFIDTWGQVQWMAHGQVIGEGPTLRLADLSASTLFVRAEVRDPSQPTSVVYTQPFTIRSALDVNGDMLVNELDFDACLSMLGGTWQPLTVSSPTVQEQLDSPLSIIQAQALLTCSERQP